MTIKNKKALLAALAVSACASASLHAATINIENVVASSVTLGGSLNPIDVGNNADKVTTDNFVRGNGSKTDERQVKSHFQFELDQLAGVDSSDIESATFSFNYGNTINENTSATLQLSKALEDFVINKFDTDYDSTVPFGDILSFSDGVATVDISAIVQDWADGGANYGLVMDFVSMTSNNGIEYVDGAKITVTTFDPIPEPSSAALLGLGGLAMVMRRRK